MKNKSIIVFAILALSFFSCHEKRDEKKLFLDINERDYIINKEYPQGDVRRYGVFPDIAVNPDYLESVLYLAQSGIKMNFPKGYYDVNLFIKGKKNIELYFNDSKFSGQIQIVQNKKNQQSQHVSLNGKLTSYSKFFTRNSNHISIDTLILASDSTKNKFGERNLGCNIYSGTQFLSIKKLLIEDLGSGSNHFDFSLAALQIHGWQNNPKGVHIEEAVIEASDRHGAYISGNDHLINNLIVKKVGQGTILNNKGLEDADIEEIYSIKAVWLNKCKNSKFNKILIDCLNTEADYTICFDEGYFNEPTIVDSLNIINNRNSLQMLPNDNTNIIVRHINQ